MIRRLIESNYFANRSAPSLQQLAFWFQEMRTPELLIDLARSYTDLARKAGLVRPLIRYAESDDVPGLVSALEEEERQERLDDRAYWLPLKQELERLRRR